MLEALNKEEVHLKSHKIHESFHSSIYMGFYSAVCPHRAAQMAQIAAVL